MPACCDECAKTAVVEFHAPARPTTSLRKGWDPGRKQNKARACRDHWSQVKKALADTNRVPIEDISEIGTGYAPPPPPREYGLRGWY